jgi:Domain of unknown function (DUF5658)
MQLNFKHFVVLQVLDILTTWYGLTYFNLTEQNIFANILFQNYGLIPSLCIGKVIMLVFVYLCFFVYPLNIKKLGINIICFIYIVVIVNNIYWILF